jgi:ABC-2 type transport system permease protein
VSEGSGQRSFLRPGSLLWFAWHELRLSLRELVKPGRGLQIFLIAVGVVVFLHVIAHFFVDNLPEIVLFRHDRPRPAAIILSIMLLSLFMMLVAQAMEAVTRAFYTRGDLELILSSPASSARVFAVRMVATTIASLALVATLILPLIHMLAIDHTIGWLGGYGVLISFSALAQAIALAITATLFDLIGPRRTRLLAQVVGALLGAGVVIGLQVPNILSSGEYNRVSHFSDPLFIAAVPGSDSLLWWPARAMMGDAVPLMALLAIGLGIFGLTVAVYAPSFAARVVTAAGVSERRLQRRTGRRFNAFHSPAAALRAKELRLIARDPWLLSQSLMQVLYLIPPALLLWKNFGHEAGALAILVPIIVMTAAQLAGGLAWLAISAEDAPDLIATAPIPPRLALRAKIEAVVLGAAIVTGPFLLVLGVVQPMLAVVGTGFGLMAVTTSTLIQYRFRTQSRRNQFRRRQRSSQIATFAETLAAISWAGASGLAAVGSAMLLMPLVAAIVITLLCLPGLRLRDSG